jgi:N-acetyl-anhydromuramoyl-L-alanine amidase
MKCEHRIPPVGLTGELASALQRPSPNQGERPVGVSVDLLVLHGISLPPGQFGGPWIDDLFLNRLDPKAHPYFAGIAGLRVSAHLLIRRDGRLIQYVPFHRRAWHAGVSRFQGRDNCNDFSIGIELEGEDHTPYEDAQYRALEEAIRAIRRDYPAIGPERIVGHADIAPGRKSDPGPAFDWARLRTLLAAPAPDFAIQGRP